MITIDIYNLAPGLCFFLGYLAGWGSKHFYEYLRHRRMEKFMSKLMGSGLVRPETRSFEISCDCSECKKQKNSSQ